MNREQIKEFMLSSNVRDFEGGSWFQSFDNNQMVESDFDKADLKIIVCFLTPGIVRAVSSSYIQLEALVRQVNEEHGTSIFIDYSYFPYKTDLDLYSKYGLPYWFGNVSKAPLKDYDVVMVSNSILMEFVNIYHGLSKSGQSYFHRDRIKDPESPLIILGGIPVADHDALNGEGGVTDLVYCGYAEGNFQSMLLDIVNKIKEPVKPNKAKYIKYFVKNYDNVYYPDGYNVVYEGHKIVSILPKYEWVPEKVQFHKEKDPNKFSSFERKIFNPDASNYEHLDIACAWGCSSGGCCNFCIEGAVCGGWREKSLDTMKKVMRDAIKLTAGNRIGFYSFNFSYYSKFIDLIYEASNMFSSMTLFNLRVDTISARPDYLDAAKALGIRLVAMPIEGMGDRVRNKILNKCLSFDQIEKAFRAALSHNIIGVKVGLILTGHETEEDFDAACEEFERLDAIKKEMNSNVDIRSIVTPLVHYPHSGIGWMKQNSAYVSYKNIKLMTKMTTRLRGKVRFTFLAKNGGTFVQQMVLNLGRLGTSFWRKLALEDNYYYYSSPPLTVANSIVEYLKGLGINYKLFLQEKDLDWIFPVDHIPKYSDSYRKFIFDSVGKKEVRPCTHTPANPTPKCYSCGYCSSKEEKSNILKRNFYNQHSVDDIVVSIFKNKPMSSYRVTYFVPKVNYMVGKGSISFMTVSNLLRNREEFLDQYHSTHNISVDPLTRGNARDWFWGKFFFDLHFKTNNPIKSPEILLNDWKSYLRDCELISIVKNDIRSRIEGDILTLSIGEVLGVSVREINERYKSMPDLIKVGKKINDNRFVLSWADEAPKLPIKMFTAISPRGSYVAIQHSLHNNPHFILSSLFKKSYKKVMSDCDIRILGYFRNEGGVCPKCGNVKLVSASSFEDPPFCVDCLSKIYLNAAIKAGSLDVL